MKISGQFTRRNLTASVAGWCFDKYFGGPRGLAEAIVPHKDFAAVELFPRSEWEMLRELGVVNALALTQYEGYAPFEIGFGTEDVALVEKVFAETRKLILDSKQFGFPSVIAFTGYGKRDDAMKARTIKRLKEAAKFAEDHGVALEVEMLNSKEFPESDPNRGMKGHPGYAGDDIQWVGDIVGEVDSLSVRLLWDLYHVQLMHGDPLHCWDEYSDLVGHVHIAQGPNRHEVTAAGDINFAPALDTIVKSGYRGRVGIEYVPTKTDPAEVAVDLSSALTLVNR